jgi:uncharacterized protein YndB with AHSA1/START domain
VAVVENVIAAPPEQVFAVLADGWSYSDWVVGTAHIRNVDDSWPSPGTRIHHSAGPWPVSLRDTTTVVSCDPPHHLVLLASLWPLGRLTVTFTLIPVNTGVTRVTIAETTAAGPLRWVHNKINDLVLHYRNQETLQRLADLATRKHRPHATGQVTETLVNKVVNR